MSTEQNNPYYGSKIKLGEAQDLIQEYLDLRNNLDIKVKPTLTATAEKPDIVSKTETFMGQTYNAFVFTKDLIMRFFDGSLEDNDQNPLSSNYLAVIMGAHPQEKIVDGETFKAGSSTVLTVGCIRKVDTKGVIRFYPLATAEPANEYPPATTIKLLPVTDEPIDGNQISYFKVLV